MASMAMIRSACRDAQRTVRVALRGLVSASCFLSWSRNKALASGVSTFLVKMRDVRLSL